MQKEEPKRGSKLRALLQRWIPGTVGVQSWLDEQGITRQLTRKFVDGGWIRKIGAGAYTLVNDDPGWLGAMYALQKMKQYKIHVAGQTALELLGYNQYLAFSEKRPKLIFNHPSDNHSLPTWFKDYFQDLNLHFVRANLFDGPWEQGLISHKHEKFEVLVSSPEKAIIESIYFAKSKTDYVYVLELLENLVTLRPSLLQELLEHCRSHKVVRLFLAMAETVNHPWFRRIDVEKLQLGKGKYVLSDGGYYNSKYQISTPIDLSKGIDNG